MTETIIPTKKPKEWQKVYTLASFQEQNRLPEVPGVYFFLDENREILYIGKATSLRDRVKSYFSRDIRETRGPKISLMLDHARHIAYRETDSVLEALILETALIKKYQPRHNTDAKDDKSFNSVVITDERYPRVLIVRGRDIAQNQEKKLYKYVFGPFPSGGGLREAMKIVRKLFPFRDKCTTYESLTSVQKEKARACFSAQVGLCPGVCTGVITPREYKKNINHIRLFFEGHKNTVIAKLKQEMKNSAKKLEFEHANDIKKTLFGLQHIQDVALIHDDTREEQTHRIEAYDVAHLGGTSAVGVMTVVLKSRICPSEYRQFKLKKEHNGNDLSALEEILIRRFKHTEWTLPEIIVVDGSSLQVAVAEKVLNQYGLTLCVLGVVKDDRHQPHHFIGPENLVKRFKKEILLANSEAHRFAITFHRKRRAKSFLVSSL